MWAADSASTRTTNGRAGCMAPPRRFRQHSARPIGTAPMSNDALAPAAIQAVIHRGVPLAAAWGIEVLAAAGGTATCRLPWQDALLRPGGTASGPALMGLADVAMWAALLGLTGGQDESLTTSLTIHFLRRLPPGAVIADARVLKRGRIIVGEVLIRSEGAGEVAAHVTTSWAAVTTPPG
jgi:uncharacterized protein (TIGR00369 family)